MIGDGAFWTFFVSTTTTYVIKIREHVMKKNTIVDWEFETDEICFGKRTFLKAPISNIEGLCGC